MAATQPNSLRLLFASTPVGAIGSGIGGGVEFILQNLAREMILRGHMVDILAPEGSKTEVDCPIIEITGKLQTSIQQLNRDTQIPIISNSVLTRMWEFIGKNQSNYHLIVNFAYDWLPFYLSPFINIPIAHVLLDEKIWEIYKCHLDLGPLVLIVLTFGITDAHLLQ